MTIAPLVMSLALAADAGAAARLEADAFAAVDGEHWCSAMTLFLEANREAPAPDLVYNAAHAADLAGDYERARALYARVGGAHRAEALERLAALRDVTATTSCAATAERAPRVVTASTATASAAGAKGPPQRQAAAAAHTAATSARAKHRGGPAAPSVEAGADAVPWDWVAIGGGGALLATGAAMVAVGAEPWLTANSAAARDDRADGNTRFDSYGKGAVVAGGALFATSLAMLAGGAALHERDIE